MKENKKTKNHEKSGSKVEDYDISEMKNSKLAILASLIWPGLGQVYNSQSTKGFIIIISQIILVLMAISSYNLLMILPAGLLLWSVYDAYQIAERLNFVIAIERKMRNKDL